MKIVPVEVYGIATCLAPWEQGWVRHVLREIRKRRPEDFGRLTVKVKVIKYLTQAEEADGTVGEWRRWPLNQDPKNPDTWTLTECDALGVVLLKQCLSRDRFIATLAHELGHACTTQGVFDRRESPDSEWAHELAADWYAYRWGFGRYIARDRLTRRFAHHCAGPGKTLEESLPQSDGITVINTYRVTKNFRLVLVSTREERSPG